MAEELQKEIAQLGISYRLMTQFTSFVAVEERVVTQDGKPVRVEVPVEMPEGVSYEGVFGNEQIQGLALNGRQYSRLQQFAYLSSAKRVRGGGTSRFGTGVGSGSAGGVAGGALYAPSTIPVAPPAPPPPAAQLAPTNDAEIRESLVDQKPPSERALLESKLHPSLLAACDCWKQSGSDCKLASGGIVEVQVWLTDDSPTVLEELEAAGFTLSQDRHMMKTVAGTLPLDKLVELVKISAVRFISRARR